MRVIDGSGGAIYQPEGSAGRLSGLPSRPVSLGVASLSWPGVSAVLMEKGYARASTLEIATHARVSERELYAEFGSKHDMLIACISARAKRLKLPADLPELRDRETLQRTLVAFGTQLLRETRRPATALLPRPAERRPATRHGLRAAHVGRRRGGRDLARLVRR